MANKFVWSGATGANDGSSWGDAYTSLARDWGAEAGFTPATDFVYVRSVHAETTTSAVSITGSTSLGSTAPVRIISVVGDTTGTDPGNLASGATVTNTGTTDIAINEGLYIYGVSFFSGDNITVGATGTGGFPHDIVLEQLRLECTGTSTADFIQIGESNNLAYQIRFINVDLDFQNASQGVEIYNNRWVWEGGTLHLNLTTLIEVTGARGGEVEITGVDLSILTGSLCTNTFSGAWSIKFRRCLLGSGFSLLAGNLSNPGVDVSAIHCQVGTDADPAFQMEYATKYGSVKTDTSRYRTGGASDGVRTNPISWDLSTSVGSVRQYPGHPFRSLPIVGWTGGDGSTAHTYRIYFASDATINNDELWFDLVGPNDAATNSLGVIKTNRVAPRTSASAHTTDSGSTWNGSGVTTKQYMDITYTPDKPGPISARICMAKASDNIYVDPKIYIDP